jgi:transposase
MISLAEHQRLVAAAVQAALAQMQQQFAAEIAQVQAQTATLQRQMAEQITPLQDALAQAKRTIAALQTKLYGVRSETSQVVLTAEGQQFIDALWGQSRETTPAPPPLVELPGTTVRRPRDRRGLAQRFPHLALHESDAALPAELAEQVAAGALLARRSGRHHDELVVPEAKPFLRRVHELELVKPGGTAPLMQVMPDRIVPGGDLADETVHRLVEAKFLDAIPFHRQLAQLERLGVEIPKQTVNDAVNAWGELFTPLSLTILAQVLTNDVVHADASWQRLQAPGACERLHLWTLLGGGQAVYRITDDLRHERARELIPAGFANRLVTDAWPGWLKLPLGERLGLCNAHARRPFADWLKRETQDPHALRVVGLYREIARCEHEAATGPPAELRDRRRRIRAERSRPVMEQIRAAAQAMITAYGTKHRLGDGASYIIDYWDGLTRFLDDPLLPTDNNAAENALRISALIRKNSLFSGSEDAAHRDAVALTILQSCRLAGLTPSDYLASVTPALLLHRRGRKQDLASLTPAQVAAGRKAGKPV